MKRKSLFKSLLVAAGLLVGGSAWAEDTYETVYTKAVTDWADADKSDWGNSTLNVDATNGLYFNPTKPGAAYSASKTFTIEENAKIKYEAVWYVGSSTGRDSNYEYIQFGDKVRISWNSNYWFYLNTNGTSSMDKPIGSKGGNTTYKKTISIIFNTATKKVESFTFDGIDLSTNVADALDGNFNSLTFGLQRGGGTSNWGYPNGLVSLTVSQCKQTVTSANYTINYKLGEAIVKTVSSSSVVGAEISADMAINGEGTYAGNHYLVVANDVPSIVLGSGTNVLNVPVRAPYTASLAVTTTVNGTANVEDITLTESDTKDCSWSYAYPIYAKSGDVYYACDETTYVFSGTFTDGETITKSVSYTKADANIVFYKEAESVQGKDPNCSWGGGGHVDAQNARDRGISVGTLPADNYLFTVNILGANRRSLVIRQSTNNPLASVGTSNEDMSTGLKSAYFALTSETENLWINGANSGEAKTNQSEDFDYVVIRKINEMVIVGDFSDNGWNVNGIAMTQSTTNDEEWTVVVDNFVAEAKNYEYKALYHGTEWYGKSNGDNQNFDFSADGYGAGTYTLTFTANTSSHTVELAVQKKDLSTYTVVGAYDNGTNQYSSFFDPSGNNKWDVNNTANDLTDNGDGTYSKIYWNVGFTEPGTIYYKVVKNHDWTDNWGMDGHTDGNAEYIVNEAGTYNIKFTFNPTSALSNGYNVSCEVIPATVTKRISKFNNVCYATYCSPYALDFSSMTGITAYNATISGNNVQFNTISEAAAGEGILLQATDEGDYQIPTTFDVAMNVDNTLIGVINETVINEIGIYVLMNGDKGVGFYKTSKAFTVGANTAYLPVHSTAREFIGFGDDTTTSINAISNEKMNGEVYNLNGQRVVAPAKGLYIVNGKKVVLK